jgi:hypothetical protein
MTVGTLPLRMMLVPMYYDKRLARTESDRVISNLLLAYKTWLGDCLQMNII